MGNMDLLGNWTVEADQVIVYRCAGFHPLTINKAFTLPTVESNQF
jgi:hypothetical protein